MSSILSERAMLARLSISQWSARKHDRSVTREVNESHGAAADAGRYNKRLLAREALAAIATIASSARTTHYQLTAPWQDDGARLLSAKLFPEYAKAMQGFRIEFESAVSQFVAGYPDYVNQARVSLNGLFDESDYPNPETIGGKFDFETQLFNVPDARDFRVDLADGQAADIRSQIETATNQALHVAMRDAWQRVADTVGHMSEKLRAYRPATETERAQSTFKDSLVENVRALADLLPGLNIANDPALADVARKLRDGLSIYDAADLRESMNARETIIMRADDVLAQVGGYLS